MGSSSIVCPVILFIHSTLYVFVELLSAGKPSFDPMHKILNLSVFQIADYTYYSNKQNILVLVISSMCRVLLNDF